MSDHTTLQETQASAGASFMPYGPPAANVRIVETFGEYEAEYAAIRKGAALFLTPHRGLVRVRGADRLAFVNQLITNDARNLPVGGGCRAMILTRHGRILGDLSILNGGEELLLITDVFQAPSITKWMDQTIFTEAGEGEDQTETTVQMSLHGPEGIALLAHIAEDTLPLNADATSWRHGLTTIEGALCHLYRADEAGVPGWHLVMPMEEATVVFGALSDAVGGLMPDVSGGQPRRFAGRGIGWHAFNTARIEAGTPLFHVDFGPDSLPHETSLLAETVSFKKGCYPGQEIVARMENLGHPKQVLVGWRGEDDRLPVAGSTVRLASDGDEVVGAMTSSTLSPLAGNTAIGFAMVRWDCHDPGTRLYVDHGDHPISGTAQEVGFMS